MFYLFAGHDYYPEGGFNDFKGSFISLELAIANLNQITNEALERKDYQSEVQWFQVVRIEYDGWGIAAKGWSRGGTDDSYKLVDVTADEDKTRRVLWMPVNGGMK